jgi:hypothetical protein
VEIGDDAASTMMGAWFAVMVRSLRKVTCTNDAI